MITVAMGLLVMMAVIARWARERWLAPGPLFAGYWVIATVLPLMLLPGAIVLTTAVVYIIFAVSAFVLGYGLATMRPAVEGPQIVFADPVLTLPRLLRGVVIAGTAAGVAAAFFALRTHGLSLSSVMSLDGILNTGNSLAVARYAFGNGSGGLTASLLSLTYAASIAAPFTLMEEPRPRRSRLLVGAPFLSILAFSTFTTERLPLLLCAAMTAAGYLAMRVLRDGEAPRVTPKAVVATVAGAALVASLFIGIAFVRVGRFDPAIRPAIQSKMSVYAYGYLPGFSQWLDAWRDETTHQGESAPLGLGTSSLAGVEYLTGQARDETRSYGQYVIIAPGGAQTNIYTGFRNILLDFGEAFGIVVLLLFGFGMGRAYTATQRRRSALMAGLLACGLTIVFLMNTMIVTTFTNVCLGMALGLLTVRGSFGRPIPLAASDKSARPASRGRSGDPALAVST
jgi:oligosaccharide repeat unit polymerase